VDSLNANSGKGRLIKAAVCAGFYPNIVRVNLPEKRYIKTEHGAVEKQGDAKGVRYFVQSGERVFVHPSSVNFSVGKYESPWLVYSERVQTTKDFLRECSEVPSLALLLLGGTIHVDVEKGRCSVDGWMHFEAPARVGVLVQELRRHVDGLLREKLRDAGMDLEKESSLNALWKILE
jgi:ATP-dependent RNA helicase DHX57